MLQKVLIALIIIATFNYKNMCQVAFNFIHCENINGINVLYIAGDRKCYAAWQVANMLFLWLWVVPFPIALSTAYYLHKQKYISTSKFMLCVLVPLSAPVFVYQTRKGRDRSIKENSEKSFRVELFQMFEQSYRPNFFWWESYRLLERCLVAAIVTFFINPVKRIIILSPLFISFLLFRYIADPYKQQLKLVKMLDLVSNAFLCLMVIINMFRAIIFSYNLPFEFPVNQVSTIAYYLEVIFSPIWFIIIYILTKKCMTQFARYFKRIR